MYKQTKSSNQPNIDYPFTNPSPQIDEDSRSYHSVDNEQQKQNYFKETQSNKQSFNMTQSKINNNQKKRAPLPPAYPYEEMKKLKQSLNMLKKSSHDVVINDTKSIKSVDSFVTANQFQSICYEEGDFQNMMNNIEHAQQPNNIPSKVPNQQFQTSALSFQSIQYRDQTINTLAFDDKTVSLGNKSIQRTQQNPSKVPNIKQSSFLLNNAQIQDFQEQQQNQKDIEKYNPFSDDNGEEQQQKYERFDEQSDIVREDYKANNQQNLHHYQYNHHRNSLQTQEKQHKKTNNLQYQQQQQQKSVQISHIQQILNKSQILDHQILQLTKQLNKIQSSQQMVIQQISYQHQQSPQINFQQFKEKIQKQFVQKYGRFESKLKQLQENQSALNSQLCYFNDVIKKAKHNNNYLKKQVQFFKQKTQKMEQNQKKLIQKQNRIRQLELNTSKNYSHSLSEKKLKNKSYNIRPKAPNNQSKQSKSYKQLAFKYSLLEESDSQKQWTELQTDTHNSPPQYQIVYSFQQQKSLFVIRIIDLIGVNQNSRNSSSSLNNKQSFASSTIRKNYQYFIDFVSNQPQTSHESTKLQSMSKQLIINLKTQNYVCKQFTKKIQIYLMIKQQNTFIDLVKVIALPNPLAFYIQRRFSSQAYKYAKIQQNQNILKSRSNLSDGKQNHNYEINQNLSKFVIQSNILKNIHKFMKSYVINVEYMADIESIQKLMLFDWINISSCTGQEIKYFSINSSWVKNDNNKRNDIIIGNSQLFYVKIQDCVVQSGQSYKEIDQKYRYSLVFKVGSNYDNQLLVDLIEFLTFLTVL